MARRLQVGWLGAAALSLSGCFQYHNAEEELLELPPAMTTDDAGVAAPPVAPSDAGVTPAPAPTDAATNNPLTALCAALTDPVQQLLCRAGLQGGMTGGTGNVGDLLGDLLGGVRRDAGANTPGQPSLEDVLEDLLRPRDGGTMMRPPMQPGSLNCTNPADAFTRILCNARRDGGTAQQPAADPLTAIFEALSDVDCDGASEEQGLTQLVCFLRDLTRGTARDGGFAFPTRPGNGNGPRGQQGQ